MKDSSLERYIAKVPGTEKLIATATLLENLFNKGIRVSYTKKNQMILTLWDEYTGDIRHPQPKHCRVVMVETPEEAAKVTEQWKDILLENIGECEESLEMKIALKGGGEGETAK